MITQRNYNQNNFWLSIVWNSWLFHTPIPHSPIKNLVPVVFICGIIRKALLQCNTGCIERLITHQTGFSHVIYDIDGINVFRYCFTPIFLGLHCYSINAWSFPYWPCNMPKVLIMAKDGHYSHPKTLLYYSRACYRANIDKAIH